MKILYLITRSDVMGGASVHLLDLALGVKKLGHEVTILVGGTGVFNEQAERLGLNVISLPSLIRDINPLLDFKAYFEIKAAIKLYSPDIIHLHSSKAGVLGRLVSTSLNIPSVFTAHGWSFTEGISTKKRLVYSWVERFMAERVNKIITVSEYDRQLALSNRVGKPLLITTIHNGVTDNSVHSKPPSKNTTNLIMVARFDAQKNQLFLIKALKEIEHLNFKMRFVGSGLELNTSKLMVKTLQLDKKIEFLGERSDVPSLLSQSNVFLLLSNWEGLPLTILEAMSQSLPVIASNVGGVSEAFIDKKQGYLISRDNTVELVDALTLLINSDKLCLNMGKAGRAYYEKNFTVEKMISKTVSVYLDILRNQNR